MNTTRREQRRDPSADGATTRGSANLFLKLHEGKAVRMLQQGVFYLLELVTGYLPGHGAGFGRITR
jgi:hypothetical protein